MFLFNSHAPIGLFADRGSFLRRVPRDCRIRMADPELEPLPLEIVGEPSSVEPSGDQMSTTPKTSRPTRRNATYIDPSLLYGKKKFMADADLQLTRAMQLGVTLETVDVGQRQYVEGVKGIEFIKAYSAARKKADSV